MNAKLPTDNDIPLHQWNEDACVLNVIDACVVFACTHKSLVGNAFLWLTVNSSHGELVTCEEFTFSPKSEFVSVNSSQRLSQGTVNSPHC